MTASLQQLTAALADRYRIERELGQGGMATVYLAQDLRHDRKVALKVLRPELAAVIGAERFLAEIKTTANLQHPHILPLFDSGRTDGQTDGRTVVYYVMPFVEGESLRDRLTREKQIPIEDAVRIAREVADALAAAHAVGIIHRDIKPENILLKGGHAMVADFGIALAVSRADGTGRMTETGMSLGTPHYMSPEQALGERTLDARTDIYALGCVLYEMLVGEPPFTGGTAQAVLAKVMTERPTEPHVIRDTIPPGLEAATLKALAKLPADRFSTASEFAEALEAEPVRLVLGPAPRPWHRDVRTLALAAGALVLGALAVWGRGAGRMPVTADPVRLTIAPPPGTRFNPVHWASVGMSADGQSVVFAATGPDGTHLYRRALDEFESHPLDGTTDAMPFPSVAPNGRSAVYWSIANKFRRVDLAGSSSPTDVTTVAPGWGSELHWIDDSVLVFALNAAAYRVSSTSGAPALLAAPDTVTGERFITNVVPVSEGRFVLSILTDSGRRTVGVDRAGKRWPLKALRGRVTGFLPPDRLLAEQDGGWTLVKIDPKSLQPVGPSEPILAGQRATGWGSPVVVPTGRAAYFTVQPGAGRRLVWVARDGRATPLPAPSGEYRMPRLSRDGRQVAFYGSQDDGDVDVALVDALTGGRVRLRGPVFESGAIWDGTGKRLIYQPIEWRGLQRVYTRPADGSGPPEVSFEYPVGLQPWSAIPNGSVFANTLQSDADIVLLVPAGTPKVLIAETGSQIQPMISPDGHWLAYTSDESGRFEVYVRPYPALDRKIPVSLAGGSDPVWSPDGRELFFLSGGQMMASRLTMTPRFSAATPVMLFETRPFTIDAAGDGSYDVAPDGRFIMVQEDPDVRIELRVELNAFKPGRR